MTEQHELHDPTPAPGGPGGRIEDTDAAALAAELARSRRTIENLQAALDTRSTIGRALGMLEERYGLDQHAAFALLTRVSNDTDTKLHVVAADFLATRELPPGQQPPTRTPHPRHADRPEHPTAS